MSIEGWHNRLAAHFQRLCISKDALGGGYPVFGLEHGLTDPDIRELEYEIHNSIPKLKRNEDYWLPWIVYATEIGYQYAGDEYWQTFEHQTPGWRELNDRHWIRYCFEKFQMAYGGIKPSGRWAEHFSIICWPITHAILPKDLQQQLAEILFKMRHTLFVALLESPRAVGKAIATHSLRASSRFKNLAQEELLLGLIASALLMGKENETQNLIHPPTLMRIATDLDSERRAREMMSEVKKHIQSERIRGFHRGKRQREHIESDKIRYLDEEADVLSVTPSLILYQSEEAKWNLLLQIPRLTPLLQILPELEKTLSEARCSVPHSDMRAPLARGFLLHCQKRVRLLRLPEAGETIIGFDRTTPELDRFLESVFILPKEHSRLFKIRSDGFAYESKSNVLTPGSSYVLVRPLKPIGNNDYITPNVIDCEDLYGARIDMPLEVSDDFREVLKSLGLENIKTFYSWPSGLPPANWDGEGRGEWLSNERPCVGLRFDHGVEELCVTLNEDTNSRLNKGIVAPGEILFLELPNLLPGSHELKISARSTSPGYNIISAYLDLIVREPRTSWHNSINQSPLLVILDPVEPTLEQLWEGKARIELYGPIDKEIECTVSLFKELEGSPIYTKQLPVMSLPISAADWRECFNDSFRDDVNAQYKYDMSKVCLIEFFGYGLGSYRFNFEREFTPVRWVVQYEGDMCSLTLIDDTGIQIIPETYYYSFEQPGIPLNLDPLSCTQGITLEDNAGMYVAIVSGYLNAIIVMPSIRISEFADLGTTPETDDYIRSPIGLMELINLIELWRNARISGSIAASFKQVFVLRALIHKLFSIICGERWGRAENELKGNPCAETLNLLIGEIRNARIAESVKRECEKFSHMSIDSRTEHLCEIFEGHIDIQKLNYLRDEPGITKNIQLEMSQDDEETYWITDFALRLAYAPWTVRESVEKYIDIGLQIILDNPDLARAARFCVLFIDSVLQERGWKIYTGWE